MHSSNISYVFIPNFPTKLSQMITKRNTAAKHTSFCNGLNKNAQVRSNYFPTGPALDRYFFRL
jgi:hypothetical protein